MRPLLASASAKQKSDPPRTETSRHDVERVEAPDSVFRNTSLNQQVRYFFGFIISIIDLMVSRDMRVKSLNCPPAVSTSPPSNVTNSPFM
jgi:hypothetical protein